VADYTTLAALKSYLRLDDSDVVDDLELARAITTASAEIDHLCSRTFAPQEDPAVARFYEPWFDRAALRWIIPIDDTFTTTGLAVHLYNGLDDYDVAVTGWTLVNPTTLVLPDSTTYTPGGVYDQGTAVKVTAKFGYPEVPAGVETACLILATRIYKRRESEFGLASTLDGSEQTQLTRRTDPDAINALRGHIKYWAAR